MTKLRKLTALLLAGALTLLLLTACSGGGGSSGPKAQAEAEVMRAINNDRANDRAAPLSNDPDMQRIAKKKLTNKLANTNLDADLNGSIGRYKFYHDVKYDKETSTLTLNCTPFVRQYGILFKKWGVFVCQRDNESTTERRR